MDMRSKSILFLLIGVLFAAGALMISACGQSGGAEQGAENQATEEGPGSTVAENQADTPKSVAPDANVTIVYYFMTPQRCPSCVRIETWAQEAIKENFSEELEKGSIIWRVVDVNQPQNAHFIKDYSLYTKSVVVTKIREEKQVDWKNLEKVWTLLGNQTAFKMYVTDEVNQFLEKS